MDPPDMIPFFVTHVPFCTALISGLIMCMTSLVGAGAFLFLTITCRAERSLYTVALALLLPCTGLSIILPFLMSSGMTPFYQGLLLLPLLLVPLSLPIRTVQPSWSATAQEMGANTHARLRLFWWPLLQKPFFLTVLLSIFCSIVQ